MPSQSLVLQIGQVLQRRAGAVVLLAILIAYGSAVPPRETFGSVDLEHIKDLLAFMFAALGLACRAVVIGAFDRHPRFRGRFYAANMLILFAIFLMHGDYYVFVFGALMIFAAYHCLLAAGVRNIADDSRSRSPTSLRARNLTSIPGRLVQVLRRDWQTAGLTFGLLFFTEVYEELPDDATAWLQTLLLSASGLLLAGSAFLLLRSANGRTVPAIATRGILVDGRVRSVDILENLLSFGRLSKILRSTLDAARLQTGDRLVDVGCGSGRLVIAAATLVGESGSAIGIDATPGMIELARKRARRAHSRARFQIGVGEALPLPDEHADAVTSSYFFHHLPTDVKRQALREMWRVLAPGGRLVITDYGRPRGVLGYLASLPMRANFYEYVRSQLGGELEEIIAAEGIGKVEVIRRFLGYITVVRLVKNPAHNSPTVVDTHPDKVERAHGSLGTLSAALIVLGGLVAASLALASQGLAFPYVGLFLTSLVAGTVLPFLPGSSEMAMAGSLALEAGHPTGIIAASLLGNVVGASTNYFVGWNIARFSDRRWFPISPTTLAKTTEWFRRYGIWLLLMCWLPTAGDAITVVAGLLRAHFRAFLVLTAVGKTIGHLVVASGVGWFV